jgi:hypothetical protein
MDEASDEHAARAAARMAEIRRAGPPTQSAVDGDLYAIHWEREGVHQVAEVGQPVGGDPGRGPVRFIFRGDPYVVVPVDQPEGILVRARDLRDAVEFLG